MPPFRRFLKGTANKTKFRGPPKKAFQSTRVNEVAQDGEEATAEIENGFPPSDTSDTQDELDEEGDSQGLVLNPYNALLQSLNTPSSTGHHRQKRRKIDVATASAPVKDNVEVSVEDSKDVLEADQEDELEVDEDERDNGEIESDLEDSLEDPMKKHLEIEERKLQSDLQGIKDRSNAEKVPFDLNLKGLITGPARCGARAVSSGTSVRSISNSFRIKTRLLQRMTELYPGDIEPSASLLLAPIFNLQDVLFCDRNRTNAEKLHQLLALHVLNYVLKTRDWIIRNTTRLAKAEDDQDLEYRDQGFTRPKVVVLLPTRQACYKFVDLIVSLYEPEQQENRKRFNETFSRKEDDLSGDKPADFRDLFGGNDDDLFRIGIKFTRKAVKFFSQFYSSDIILASPLGLRMALTKKDSNKEDFDFLSSIELMIVDHADALHQQNWDHVEHIFSHLNLQPKENHGCDFSRVRNWYLDGNARYLRQTIILSSFLIPELNQIHNQHMLNIEGTLKISPKAFEGAIVGLGTSMKQIFLRFDAFTPQKEPDARFKAFTARVLPNVIKIIKSGAQGSHGVLVFIPSYMDFVRVRNFMANSTEAQDLSFGAISEYTASSDVARARSHFVSGRHSVLLYSGRAHHFRRYMLKGVKRVIMYSLPDNALFYTEVAGDYIARSVSEGLIAPEDASVRSLFCKWDVLRLERVVGSKRVSSMLNNKGGETFDFA